MNTDARKRKRRSGRPPWKRSGMFTERTPQMRSARNPRSSRRTARRNSRARKPKSKPRQSSRKRKRKRQRQRKSGRRSRNICGPCRPRLPTRRSAISSSTFKRPAADSCGRKSSTIRVSAAGTRSSACADPVRRDHLLYMKSLPYGRLFTYHSAEFLSEAFAHAEEFTDAVRMFARNRARLFRAGVQNFIDAFRVRHQVVVPVARGSERFLENLLQLAFRIAPAHSARAVMFGEVRGLFRRREKPVKAEHVACIGVFLFLDSLTVRHYPADLFLERLRLEENFNRIVVGLAHLAAVEAGNHIRRFLNERFRHSEHVLAVLLIETDRYIAREFHVLLLVLAHRHNVRVEHQDVRVHQARVAIEADNDVRIEILVLGAVRFDFRLVGVRAVHESLRRETAERPAELENFGDVALLVEKTLLRIESEGEPRRGDFVNIVAHLRAVVHGRERVIIRNEIKGIVSFSERKGRADSPEEIAEMGRTGGLDARKGNLFHSAKCSILQSGATPVT